MLRGPGSAFALLGVVVVVSGCGGSPVSGPKSAADAVRVFLKAVAARDAPAACGVLSDSGRGVMAAYPERFGPPASNQRCETAVRDLSARPHADAWKRMANGRICVSRAAGLDASAVFVIYRQGGREVIVSGEAQPNLVGRFAVTIPPTPARPQQLPVPPQDRLPVQAACD